jgi:murein L,D-transpeptidase YcbB/YkuD
MLQRRAAKSRPCHRWRVLLCGLVATWATASAQDGGVSGSLREITSGIAVPATAELRGIGLGAGPLLAEFYAARGFQPAWADPARVDELLALLSGAPDHGLDPADFFTEQLRELAASAPGDADRAALDVLLTEALVRYGYQRRFGKVNPADLEPAWNFTRGFVVEGGPGQALAEAIAAPSLAAFLDQRIPGGPWYRQLQSALGRYRAIALAGGWPDVPAGAVLRPGERDARLPVLRERLKIEGDLAAQAAAADPDQFDDATVAAVKSFQRRHSLSADGVVGRGTLAALNVAAAARVDQLRMSLERVRWLTGDVPSTYVVVNIAGFRAGFVRDGRLVWNSRVVVGRAARQTPVFRGSMTYVELNPTWTVPPTILREDILPKLHRDPGYLQRETITVIDRSGRVVDPYAVDWKAFSRGVPYTLRQEPGPQNALGRIKLMFPNEHSVYLHDTPSRSLFDKPERTFSSGCIRVEDPLGLAELALDDPDWTRSSLEQAIATDKTRRVPLREPVPVLLVYLTAIADPDGTTRFFRDVYGRDRALLAALDGPVRLVLPPASPARSAKLGAASL